VIWCLTASYGYFSNNNDLPTHAVAVANDAVSLDDHITMTSWRNDGLPVTCTAQPVNAHS